MVVVVVVGSSGEHEHYHLLIKIQYLVAAGEVVVRAQTKGGGSFALHDIPFQLKPN